MMFLSQTLHLCLILQCSCRTATIKNLLTAFTVLLSQPARPQPMSCCASLITVQPVASPCSQLSIAGHLRIPTTVQHKIVTVHTVIPVRREEDAALFHRRFQDKKMNEG